MLVSMLFSVPSSLVWALWPDLGQTPLQNKWRAAAASLSAGARGPASTHSTPYQVCTNKCINRKRRHTMQNVYADKYSVWLDMFLFTVSAEFNSL